MEEDFYNEIQIPLNLTLDGWSALYKSQSGIINLLSLLEKLEFKICFLLA